jgi:hypothetical protein
MWASYLNLSSDSPPDGTDNARGLGGYVGEAPSTRAERVCDELGLPFESFGDDSGTNFAMGPQLPGRALDILRDCESTGRAIMTDHLGLIQFYCLSEAYNQDPFLTVDGSNRELFLPYSPTLDDLGRANVVTMQQPNGTSATLRDEDDINGVPGLRAARGEYAKGPIPINVADPLALLQQAGFERARGTQQRRYPTITLDGLRAPGQGLAMLADARPRAKVRITNPPLSQRRDDVDVLLKGWTMTVLGPRKGWMFVCNTVQSGPYEVPEYDAAGARYESVSSALGADRTFGGVSPPTTMTITTNGAPGELWTVAPSAYPIDVMVGGCRIRITAMSGAASPQTATISTTVINGAAKTVSAGTAIRLWDPVKYGL